MASARSRFAATTPQSRLLQNTYPVWNATPVLALDVYEHAYWLDYGRARAKYIDAFFNNLDWGVVAANLDRALSMHTATK